MTSHSIRIIPIGQHGKNYEKVKKQFDEIDARAMEATLTDIETESQPALFEEFSNDVDRARYRKRLKGKPNGSSS